MDYHGVAVTDKTYQDLIRNRSVPTEFVLEIGAPVKRFIDASSEVCVEHPTNRCLGRLANHSTLNSKKNLDANMKIIEVVLKAFDPPKRLAVFKARRNIEPFEQLRYDYGDKVARNMFNMWSSQAQLFYLRNFSSYILDCCCVTPIQWKFHIFYVQHTVCYIRVVTTSSSSNICTHNFFHRSTCTVFRHLIS